MWGALGCREVEQTARLQSRHTAPTQKENYCAWPVLLQASQGTLFPAASPWNEACADQAQRFFQNLQAPHVATCAGKQCSSACAARPRHSAWKVSAINGFRCGEDDPEVFDPEVLVESDDEEELASDRAAAAEPDLVPTQGASADAAASGFSPAELVAEAATEPVADATTEPVAEAATGEASEATTSSTSESDPAASEALAADAAASGVSAVPEAPDGEISSPSEPSAGSLCAELGAADTVSDIFGED